MFDPARVFRRGLPIHADIDEKSCQILMAFIDRFRNFSAGIGQADPAAVADGDESAVHLAASIPKR